MSALGNYGIEPLNTMPLGSPESGGLPAPQGSYSCGASDDSEIGRVVAEHTTRKESHAGIKKRCRHRCWGH